MENLLYQNCEKLLGKVTFLWEREQTGVPELSLNQSI